MKLKIGMKVKYINNDITRAYKQMGKVICIVDDEVFPYGIEFERDINSGCDCYGHGKIGYCWWADENDIMPINQKQRIK